MYCFELLLKIIVFLFVFITPFVRFKFRLLYLVNTPQPQSKKNNYDILPHLQ
jgi:hypothetical protein